MTKSSLRSMAAGILLATFALAPILLFIEEDGEAVSQSPQSSESSELTDEEVDAFIEERGYTMIESEEYEELQRNLNRLEAHEDELMAFREEAEEAEESEPSEDSEEEESSEEDRIYQLYLVIGSGMSSGEIAILLEDAQIIEDGADFRQYIEDNDLVMAIKAGRYMLDSSMSVSEIAEEIT
ncbi:hypothetical protein CR194_13715 [Salipaludibacillus keqinensis]|uniref:Endolytic transglycosylase MltG n=1 Tax=Salipaludibacillus keqinensis TaxID=2045207 RepID=A0A323TCH5_9BACI|nr:hypothetical protein [Salipaludibacillus keqinensis]PYZ92709.1 hypothetical protein CR194_13715 [Salipaludibacillus keqinensis]